MKKLVQIFISILLFVILIQLLKSNNYDIILGCGLFAFIGSKSSQFDWMSFNILGVYNDPRGKDSCGRVINNTIEKGIKKLAKYEEFVQEISNPDDIITKIILGHTRRTSVGEISIVNAQPIIFKKSSPIVQRIAKKDKKYSKWLKSLKHNSIVFAGIHNGTIYNYKELAETHNISLVDDKGEVKTDSIILFEILIQNKFDVLTKYNGTAALVFHNYYNNNVYVFKGKSSYSKKGNTYEEKPLYIWKQPKGGYYFSSIKTALRFIGGKNKEITDLPTNILFQFKNGVIIKEKPLNRENSQQKEAIFCETYYGEHHHNNKMGFEYNKAISHAKSYMNSNTLFQGFFENEENKEWQDEIVPKQYLNYRNNDRLLYLRGRYRIGDTLAKGLIITTEYGKIYRNYEEIDDYATINYFLDGLLMTNKDNFFQALAIRLKSDSPKAKDTVQKLIKCGKYPSCLIDKKAVSYQDCYSNNLSYGKTTYFTGSINPMYSKRLYTFDNGDLSSIEELKTIKESNHKSYINNITSELKEYKENFKSLLEKNIELSDCVFSDAINTTLISILEEKSQTKYLIDENLLRGVKKLVFPEVDFKELKKKLNKKGISNEVSLELLDKYSPCNSCDYDEDSSKCTVCPVLEDYLDLWKEYTPKHLQDIDTPTKSELKSIHDDTETEKQLTEEAIDGLTDKLLETVEDLENELYILGTTDITKNFANILSRVRNSITE